jgi:hypothetical protein
MLRDDFMRDGKSESRTFIFSCEKQVENAPDDVRRNAAAGVFDFDCRRVQFGENRVSAFGKRLKFCGGRNGIHILESRNLRRFLIEAEVLDDLQQNRH